MLEFETSHFCSYSKVGAMLVLSGEDPQHRCWLFIAWLMSIFAGLNLWNYVPYD